MALRIEWDKYEVALLIDACEQVSQKRIPRSKMVALLSSSLRLRAEIKGMEIDDIFRNENGISLQMTKMEYLLTDGMAGLPGASKLYVEIAELRKNHPEEFFGLLREAQGQIRKKEKKVELDNKTRFKQWLQTNPPKKYAPEKIMQALEEGSEYCRSHGICKESFWDISDKSRFVNASSRLLGLRFYRLFHRSTASVLDIAIPMYKDFLIVQNVVEIPDKGRKEAEPFFEVEEQKGSFISEADLERHEIQNSIRESLEKTIEYLKTRYDVRLYFNHTTDSKSPSKDLLYKARNDKRDILWVYYIESKSAHYISIETEPEYLERISGNLIGFSRIQTRVSHPCQKLIYEDYYAIKESLTAICDAIDHYFAADDNEQSSEDYKKLCQKLYSISRVYDNPSGIAISKIISFLGKEVDEQIVRKILDEASWATQLNDDFYSFSRNSALVLREKERLIKTTSSDLTKDTAFFDYLHKERGLAEATCRSIVSSIRTAQGYAKDNNYNPYKIYDNTTSDAMRVIQSLLKDSDFLKFNSKQHNRFFAALAKFSEYIEWTEIVSSGKDGQVSVLNREITDFDKEKFEQTLLKRYRNGMQFDSIDFENFREMYDILFDETLLFSDSELEKRIRLCGIVYKDRIFPAEGIIDKSTKEKLFAYISNSFKSGKKVLYYKAIFEELADSFENCFTLTDENMLRAYIEYTAEKGLYYFFSKYMSVEKNVSIDDTAEIEEYLLTAGKPVSTDEVCTALSHIPKGQIVKIISTDNRFLRNAKSEYFHVGIFEISETDIERIAEIIDGYIKQNEYAIWTDVWNDIQEKMPIFIENNLYLSWLGLRNALAKRYNGRFNFVGAVISLPKDHYAMRDIYQLYAKHHTEFTMKDIYNLSKELDTVIYFDALAEVSVRVSHDLFVSKDKIHFDIDAVEKAIGSFLSRDYIRIREIDSYLIFPNIGYEWNEYLLESFIYSYSKKYKVLNNGFSQNNVAGVVVKRNGSIQEFVDACAVVLADSPIALNKKEALNYLAEVNVITRRSYRDLDSAITKATQIRSRKG